MTPFIHKFQISLTLTGSVNLAKLQGISTQAIMVLSRRTRAPKPLSKSPIEYGDDDATEYSDVCCEKCGSGDCAAKLLLCDKCDRGYHLFCVRPILVSVPKGSWFCPTCSMHKIKLKCTFMGFRFEFSFYC